MCTVGGGVSAPDDDTVRAILAGLRHGDVHITADRCTGDSRAVYAFCDLVRVAPSLAEEVLRLRRGGTALEHIASVAGRGDLCKDDPLDAWGHELGHTIKDLRERAERAETELAALVTEVRGLREAADNLLAARTALLAIGTRIDACGEGPDLVLLVAEGCAATDRYDAAVARMYELAGGSR